MARIAPPPQGVAPEREKGKGKRGQNFFSVNSSTDMTKVLPQEEK
jgi:hypothetical protein